MQATKFDRGVELYLHLFLTLTVDESNWSIHAPAALPQEKHIRYPLDRRLDGPHSLSGPAGRKPKFLRFFSP
jgi:hypothetical protein